MSLCRCTLRLRSRALAFIFCILLHSAGKTTTKSRKSKGHRREQPAWSKNATAVSEGPIVAHEEEQPQLHQVNGVDSVMKPQDFGEMVREEIRRAMEVGTATHPPPLLSIVLNCVILFSFSGSTQ